MTYLSVARKCMCSMLFVLLDLKDDLIETMVIYFVALVINKALK